MNDFLTSTIHLTYVSTCGYYAHQPSPPLAYPEKPFHSINLLTTGHAILYYYDGRKLHIGPNEFYYLPKNKPYDIVHEERTKHYSIVFDFIEEEGKDYDFFATPVHDNPRYLANFQYFIKNYKQKKIGYVNQCYQAFYALIGDIQTQMNSQYISFSQKDLLNKAYDYIFDNLCSPDLTVAAISKMLDVSPGYFRNLFAKKYSLSPKKYISSQRISKACTLLQNTSLSIQEISDQVGFNDASHFGAEFKKIHKISPTEYRKHNRYLIPNEVIYEKN